MRRRRLRRTPRRRSTYLVLLGAVAVSVALAVMVLRGGQSPAAAPTAQKARGSDFGAVAGPSCPEDRTRRVRISTAPGSSGWQRGRGETGPGDGCGDGFLYVDPGYDADNTVQWLFTFRSAAARSCRVDVYVPDSPHASAEVWYDVADRFVDVEEGIAAFTVDQYANRGVWVSATSVLVETTTLLVHLEGAGQDLTPDRTGVTAGPVRVSCTELTSSPA